jgi:hypothetical protein
MVPFGLVILIVRGAAAVLAVLLAAFRPNNTILKKLGVSAASVLLCLVLSEGVLRLVYSPAPRRCGWRSSVSAFEINDLGFRGHPIEYSTNDFVVVLLGDSQVEAKACAYGWMPERRLEYHLNRYSPSQRFRVFTVGAGGYGQDQQLLTLGEYYGRYRADLVLLWQVFPNDVWNNVFPSHWPANGKPKPTFRLQDGRLVGPNVPMGEDMTCRSAVRVADLLCNAMLALDKPDDRWESYLPPPYEPMTEFAGPANTDWQHRWNINLGMMRLENLANEKSHLAVSLTPRSSRTQYGLDLTRALLSEIRALVEANSGRFCIFRAGSMPRPSADTSTVRVLNGKFYRTSTAQRYANEAYVNAGFRTLVVPITVKDHRVGPADAHLNEHAMDQVMRDLAQKLVAEVLPDADTAIAAEN